MDTAVRGPIRRLPTELLAETFLHYVAEGLNSSPVELPIPPTLILCQICSNWRHFVYATPKLWVNFSLDIDYASGDDASFAKAWTKAWLSRARPYPLNVSLLVNTPTKALNGIVDAILSDADRLQVIELQLPLSYFQPLFNVAAGSMALLERVNLSVVPYYGSVIGPWGRKLTAFATAPRLRSVTLCSTDLLDFNIQFPWSQLTELYIGEASNALSTCRNALLQCTNLVDCTLHMHLEAFTPAVPIVVLPRLKKLNVAFEGLAHDSLPFFQPLNLPALKDLTVSRCPWSQQIFMEFTSRSSFDLERLRFNFVKIRPDELLQVLPHMQSLVELEVQFSQCVNDSLFNALCYRKTDSRHLVPQLKILNIRASSDDIDDNGIANMIESRWWTDDAPHMVSRFEIVILSIDGRKIDVRARERVEHCRREGLALCLDQPDMWMRARFLARYKKRVISDVW
jgi:hypothetical protein